MWQEYILYQTNWDLKTNTWFIHWKTFKYVCKNLVCESTSNVNFMKSKYSSGISNENLACTLRCKVKIPSGIQRLSMKTTCISLLFILIKCQNDNILG